jgi:hypothetical protein
MNLTLGPVIDNGPIIDEPSLGLDNGRGFPEELFIVALGEGQFLFGNFDTRGMEPDPVYSRGLYAWADIEDARNHAAAYGGVAVEKSLYECRRIVELKGQTVDPEIKAVLLMVGDRIIEVLWVRS